MQRLVVALLAVVLLPGCTRVLGIDAPRRAPPGPTAPPDAGEEAGPGALACPAPTVRCENACVDALTDGHHCGTCGRDCLGATCLDGRCQPLDVAVDLFAAGKLAVAADGSAFFTAYLSANSDHDLYLGRWNDQGPCSGRDPSCFELFRDRDHSVPDVVSLGLGSTSVFILTTRGLLRAPLDRAAGPIAPLGDAFTTGSGLVVDDDKVYVWSQSPPSIDVVDGATGQRERIASATGVSLLDEVYAAGDVLYLLMRTGGEGGQPSSVTVRRVPKAGRNLDLRVLSTIHTLAAFRPTQLAFRGGFLYAAALEGEIARLPAGPACDNDASCATILARGLPAASLLPLLVDDRHVYVFAEARGLARVPLDAPCGGSACERVPTPAESNVISAAQDARRIYIAYLPLAENASGRIVALAK